MSDTTNNSTATSETVATSDILKIVVIETARATAIATVQTVGAYATLAVVGIGYLKMQELKEKRAAKKAAAKIIVIDPEND